MFSRKKLRLCWYKLTPNYAGHVCTGSGDSVQFGSVRVCGRMRPHRPPYQHHHLRRPYNTIIDPTEYNWHLRGIHVVVPRIRSDPTEYKKAKVQERNARAYSTWKELGILYFFFSKGRKGEGSYLRAEFVPLSIIV